MTRLPSGRHADELTGLSPSTATLRCEEGFL